MQNFPKISNGVKVKIISIFVLLGFVLTLPAVLDAQRVGVGVTTGRITVDETLKAGGVYYLPAVGVVNTGDIAAHYTISITFDADQKQLRPNAGWFVFSPSQFYLEPGKSQAVKPMLTLPIRTSPGDYFAYLEVAPAREEGPGTQIGVAAATRLYFAVAPANIFQGMYYRTLFFISKYAPWTYVALVLIALAVLIAILKRFISFNVKLRSKDK